MGLVGSIVPQKLLRGNQYSSLRDFFYGIDYSRLNDLSETSRGMMLEAVSHND